MLFEVVQYQHQTQSTRYPRVVLTTNSWNDYGWTTTFQAALHAAAEAMPQKLGTVKILQRGKQSTQLDREFELLPEDYCSLGGRPEYYRTLFELDPAIRDAVLRGLRDAATNRDIREAFADDLGFSTSLLRFPEAREALTVGERLQQGEKAPKSHPTEVRFAFATRLPGFEEPHQIAIDLNGVRPLGRSAVLIGANGAGKTRLLARLAYAAIGLANREKGEKIVLPPNLPGGVLAISWSAFDRFEIPRGELPTRYKYCGLRRFGIPVRATRRQDGRVLEGRSRYEPLDLDHAITTVGEELVGFSKEKREGLLETLLRMRLASPEQCRSISDAQTVQAFGTESSLLSAGQQLVVFTLVTLIGYLLPGTLVLFDEPEAHLHPTLLSALLRELHDLLDRTESFAILATHDPLILQEIPSRQVFVLESEDGHPVTRSYAGETFGETVTRLMDSVFGVGGEQKNWRTLIADYRRQGRLDELRAVLNAALNLPLSGVLDDDAAGAR